MYTSFFEFGRRSAEGEIEEDGGEIPQAQKSRDEETLRRRFHDCRAPRLLTSKFSHFF